MTLDELLSQRKDAILARWLEAALSAYPEEGSAAFARNKDPFANPVGHSLRVGTREVFEALLGGMDEERIRQHLHEIIRIRAVQDLTPSRAVGFVFDLKEAVRVELGDQVEDLGLARELASYQGLIDKVSLAAFDIFVECRQKLSELRINEVKRQVSWVVGKINARGPDSELAPAERAAAAPGGADAPEEDDVEREGAQ